MIEKEQPAFPLFVFVRCHDIELEGGLILAGNLVLDIPRPSSLQLAPTADQAQLIQEIVGQLSAMARAGQMPDDAFILGWPHASAADVHDDATLAAWAEERVKISIRIDPRDDGMVRIDSDLAWQLGLVQER